MVGMTYLLGKLFKYISIVTHHSDGSLYQILAANWTWYVPACLLSFGLIAIPMSLLYHLILGNEGYSEYLLFTNIKHGFDGMKVMKPIFILSTILGIVGVFLLGNYSIKLYQDKIEIHPFLTTKIKTIDYKDIKAIHFVHHKLGEKDQLIPFPHYVIIFDKEMEWIADDDHALQTTNNKKVIAYLKERAKSKVDTIAVYKN